MSEKIEFDISVKNNGLSKALDEGSKKASQLEGILNTALGVFGGNIATQAFSIFTNSFNSLISTGKEAVNAAAEQEVAINNLNNALARSGNYTKQASEDLQNFASQLQETTIFQDDAVLSSLAYLESLTNLSSNGLKQAGQAAADLATILRVDLDTATSMIAKGVEGNVGVFQRYGIEVKKGKNETENLTNVLKSLSSFQGAASSQLNTYTGSVKALNNSYGELLESAGNIIVKNPLVVGAINALKDKFLETSKNVTKLTPELQELLTDGFLALMVAGMELADILDGFTIIGKAMIGTIQGIGAAMLASFIEPIEKTIGGLLKLNDFLLGSNGAFAGLENPLSGATEALKKFSTDGLDKVLKSADSNVFRDIHDNLVMLTNSTIENSAKVATEEEKNGKNRTDNEIKVSQQIIDARNQLNADLMTIRGNLAAEEAAFNANMVALGIENEFAQNEAKIIAISDQKMKEAEAVYQGELLKNKSIQDAQQQQLANDKAYQTFYLATKKAYDQKEIDLHKNTNAQKKKDDDEYKNARQMTLATIASLQTEGNKTLAAIGKAAALTQIAINTSVGITEALKLGPFIGPPAAAAVAAAMAVQASKVIGIKLEDGGFVGGLNGATGGPDNRIAQVRDGEMVLNASQQRNLLNMINSGSAGGDIIVQVDGREIARAVRSQVQSGFRLA
jgi:hypothetical protein